MDRSRGDEARAIGRLRHHLQYGFHLRDRRVRVALPLRRDRRRRSAAAAVRRVLGDAGARRPALAGGVLSELP